MDTYDLVVIGLGPGGESVAAGAARAGLRVLAVDKHLVGGECPYYGCVPTKMMVRAADTLAETARARALAGATTATPDWSLVAARIREQATDNWDDQVAVDRMRGTGAECEHATARLAGPGQVRLTAADGSERLVGAAKVLLNPGTRPAVPPIPGLADTPYWTNRDVVAVTQVPASLVVLGGGPIGCEVAQVFARFGAEVSIVQRGPRLVPASEPEASTLIAEVFASEGIRVLAGVDPTHVSHDGQRFAISAGEHHFSTEQLLVAAGRTPNLDDVGLETVGLDAAAGILEVDERLRVRGVDDVWAIGDVVGHGAFTHVSMYQAAIALRDILGEPGPPANYAALPHVTFTDPEVAGVGLTEQTARERGLAVQVGVTPLESSSRGWLHGEGGRGLIKVVADGERGVLVGGCVVGPAAGEILGFLAVAVQAQVPVATLRSMMYAYPTFHRAIETALSHLE